MTRLLLTLTFLALTAAAGAQSSTPPKGGAGRASAPATPADANGFRIGDVVEISTGQGWMKGTILSANGNVYRVRSQIGIDTTKLYPDEVRRIGPLTPKDRAAGQVQPARRGSGQRQRRVGGRRNHHRARLGV